MIDDPHKFDRLDGQVVAISGAGGGIGREIALDLAARGAHVVVNDYGTSIAGDVAGDPGPAARVVQEIVDAGGKAVAVLADVGSKEGADAIVAAALETFGRIDGIVHGACVFPPQGAFEDLNRANFQRVVDVTVNGAWGLCQAAWPHFKRQKYGRVVLIQSAAGFYGRLGMPAYSIAKSSFIGFTSYLTQEGAPHGIMVNNLSPVAWSRVAAVEEGLGYLEAMMPASDIGPLVALMVHPGFDRSGLMLHSGGSVVTAMFVPETQGVAFARGALSPSTVFARLDEIIDEHEYRRPRSTDDVGIALFEAVAARDKGEKA